MSFAEYCRFKELSVYSFLFPEKNKEIYLLGWNEYPLIKTSETIYDIQNLSQREIDLLKLEFWIDLLGYEKVEDVLRKINNHTSDLEKFSD